MSVPERLEMESGSENVWQLDNYVRVLRWSNGPTTSPVAAPTSSVTIYSYYLVNADTDEDHYGPIYAGETYYIPAGMNYNIRAEASGDVEAVRWSDTGFGGRVV